MFTNILRKKKKGGNTLTHSAKQENPLISVIVTSYNYADLIEDAINSILSQTYRHFEIIIVDDGSQDNSIDIIRHYTSLHDNITLYTHPQRANRGLPESIRLAVSHAQGKYLAFCESDDKWHPMHLEKKVQVINTHSNPTIISNDVELFGNEDIIAIRKDYIRKINTALKNGINRIDLLSNKKFNYLPTLSAVMIRKDALVDKNFQTPIPAWIDFWLYRQILKSAPLYYIKEKLTYWNMHESFNDPNKLKTYEEKSDLFFALSDKLLGFPVSPQIQKAIDTIATSPLFDETYYRTKYGQNLNGLTPAEHYFYIGWKKNYNPSEEFSGAAYLYSYSDLRDTLLNPLLHFEQHGRKEGREFYSVAQAKHYRITEDDVARIQKARSNNKTILLISHEMSLTGAPRALFNMAQTLQTLHVTPVFVSLRPGPMEKEVRQAGIQTLILPFIGSEYSGNVLFERFINCFDVILFNTLETISLTQYFQTSHIPKLAWLHEGYFSYRSAEKRLDLPKLLAVFDRIYTVGNYARSFVEKYLADMSKVENLYYGMPDIKIPDNYQSKNSPNSKTTFLLAGTLCKRKGQRILLKSLWWLPWTVRKKIRILIAGYPAEWKVVQALKHSPFSCVEYIGEKSHDELMRLYSDIDVVLCPSLDDPMPIVCTEAMIFSKPVIVSDHTGTASFIKDGFNGYVIAAHSPKALAQAIRRIVKHKAELSDWGKTARKIYDQEFTMDVFEQRIRQILAEI